MIREAKSHLSGLVGIMLDEALDPCACRRFWMDFYQNCAEPQFGLLESAINSIYHHEGGGTIKLEDGSGKDRL